jgi:hypothetical protein
MGRIATRVGVLRPTAINEHYRENADEEKCAAHTRRDARVAYSSATRDRQSSNERRSSWEGRACNHLIFWGGGGGGELTGAWFHFPPPPTSRIRSFQCEVLPTNRTRAAGDRPTDLYRFAPSNVNCAGSWGFCSPPPDVDVDKTDAVVWPEEPRRMGGGVFPRGSGGSGMDIAAGRRTPHLGLGDGLVGG